MLNKQEKWELSEILRHAKRANDYLMNPDVFVCGKSDGTTTIEYKNNQGDYITCFNKEIGNDLTGLDFAISGIKQMLERK